MGRKEKAALILWIAFAILVWNIVFDRVIVVAGRDYVAAALDAVKSGRPYLRMGDWMAPAAVRGAGLATAAAAVVLLVGLGGLAFARRRGGRATA